MGVIFTEHFTYNAGTFLIWLRAHVVDTFHTKENTAVNGLETVTNIRKGTCHDDRHRIVDVGTSHFFLDVDFDNSVVVKRLTVVECLIFVHCLYLLISFLSAFFCVLSA